MEHSIDDEILAAIIDGQRTFTGINRALNTDRTSSTMISLATIDRRLQALRKQGRIECGWHITDSVKAEEPSKAEQQS